MKPAALLAIALLALVGGRADAQSTRSSEEVETMDLKSALARGGKVRTHGTLSPLELPTYWVLSEDQVRVVLIPVPELETIVLTLAGHRVEVVGLVRGLPDHADGVAYPPDLPPLPGRADKPASWPGISISIWSILDLGRDDRSPTAPRGRLAALLAGTPDTKAVTIVGRFCGATPCARLSAATIAGAWAIQDGDDAVWVVGKEPRGKGFRLDPAYAGDRSRWVEVTGRLERCGSDWCLRARDVALARAPSTGDEH